MSDFFIGQIMLAGFNFAPRYFAQCNGQLLPINQNAALFSLLGTQYGGNGTTNFQLPDLRGRTPIAYASSVDGSWQPAPVSIGENGGAEAVTLTTNQIPAHTHAVQASTNAGNSRAPTGRLYATNTNTSTQPVYAPGTPNVQMTPSTVSTVGQNQPHPNMQPYGVVNFCIALAGIFPSRN